MPRAARLDQPAADHGVTTPLAALAEIAAALAQERPLDQAMPEVLAMLARRLAATECTVWLGEVDSLARAWSAGAATIDAAIAAAVLAGEVAEGVRVEPLSAGGRALGALSVRLAQPLDGERRALLSTVALLLAPVLSQAERSRRLEVEVELRTRQIEEQRRFTERIIDSLPVGLYVIDREYRIQAWNRKRETGMQGVSREEAIGRTIFEILHRQPAEMLRREFEDVFATGRMQTFQMESTASGEVRTYRISKIPMRIGDAQVTHIITIGEDITEWRDAEERIAQAEKLAAIGTLAAGVMHEINNPLATVAACAESMGLVLDGMRERGLDVPADTSDFLTIIDNEVHRCKRIIDGLLDFSRPKQGIRELLDVNAVIDKTLFLLKHHARFKKLAVETETDERLVPVMGNEEQLIQVFMALLLNAMDAMGDRGTVRLRTKRGRKAAEAVVAEVIDEGQGMRRTELGKIFEPFYTTKPPGRGTGLGLSICYGIIAEHGGRIEVESAVGKGSTFRILLPAGAAEPAEAVEA